MFNVVLFLLYILVSFLTIFLFYVKAVRTQPKSLNSDTIPLIWMGGFIWPVTWGFLIVGHVFKWVHKKILNAAGG